MTIFNILLAGASLLGIIVGSFLNALSYRFNTGQRFWSARGMGGRSRCMRCNHQLHALDLIPILSFVYLGGRCRYCGTRLSLQYPIVEIGGGVLGALVYLMHPLVSPAALAEFVLIFQPIGFLFWFVVWMTLLFVVVYDIKHTIIPWSCSGLLAALAVVSLFVHVDTLQVAMPGMWAVLAGPLTALPLFLLSLVSRGTWMGWGDSALEISLGWFLGLSLGFSALMLAFWIGAVVGIALLVLSRVGFFGYTIRSEIPFAPFLVLGAALAYFFHVDIFSSISPLFY